MSLKEEAQGFVDELKQDSKKLIYVLSILKELEHWQGVANDLGNQVGELKKEVSQLKSNLRKGRALYRAQEREIELLKKEIEEFN